MKSRTRIALPAVALLAVLLTGCTPPWTGISGVARTADGSLSGVVVMCKGTVEGLTMLFTDESDKTRVVGDWEYPEPVSDEGEVAFPSDVLSRLDEGTDYRVYSWSRDASATAWGPEFSVAELAALQPGEVWAEDYRSEAGGPVALSADDFDDSARAFCEG